MGTAPWRATIGRLSHRLEALAMSLAPTLIAALCALALATPADAHIVVYQATLSGPAEAPPNASPGTGARKPRISPPG